MTVFLGLDAAWAAAVRRVFTGIAARTPGDPRVIETRVADDLCLLVRYLIRGAPLAVRYRLDVDPSIDGPPIDADRLASGLFHDLHASDPPSFTDPDGYRWWGEEPPDGWASLHRHFTRDG